MLTLAVVGFAVWQLWRQWTSASRTDLQLDVNVWWLLLATLVVFATYALLIETWRMVLSRLGATIGYGPATRIWFASNLGKYVPGKIWTVSAMMFMAAEQGVPLAISGASAVVITIAQVATGFAVVFVTSTPTVQRLTGGTTGVMLATVGMVLCLAAAPILARQWNRLAARLGKEQLSVTVPMSAVVIALVGCAASWLAYGVAFELFVRGVISGSGGSWSAYTAAYGASYLVGLLAVFAPGGIGAREIAMSVILAPLGLATHAQAAVITVASRLWLTAAELAPSLIAAARSAARPPATP